MRTKTTLSDLEDFFQPDDGKGEELGERIVKIMDKFLRGKQMTKN